MKHTKAVGILPYDHFFGGGFKVGHDGFSTISRTNKLRETFFNTTYKIDAQRAVLVTEAYQKYNTYPQEIKMARALENVLNNVEVHIYPNELIAGGIAAPNKHAPIYPEFSFDWVIDEMENKPFEDRVNDIYQIDDSEKEKLRSIADFWKNNTLAHHIDNQLHFDEQKASELGIGMYLLNLYHYGGIGHFCMNYPKLMEIGYAGYKDAVNKQLAALTVDDPEFSEKRNLYEAMLINLNASSTYFVRHAQKAEEMAASATGVQKDEYLQIASNLRHVSEHPPRNTWEALQLWHLATCITLIESNGHSVSYGRMDQWLNPIYENDMKNGNLTKEFVQELLESAFIKANNPCKLRDELTTAANSGRGWGGESLTIGGVNEKGEDATTDLTMMMLDASAHTRMMVPWVCTRMHDNTPYELKVKVAECVRAGFGHPKVFNDEVAIPAAVSKGRTIEEARNYAVVGCVEIDTPGYEFGWHDAAYMNITRPFELAVNDGKCFHCGEHCPRYAICAGDGKKLGVSTGSLENFKNMNEVIDAYNTQMKYFTDQMVAGINIMDHAHRKLKPTPYVSMFIEGCIDEGKDLTAGGAVYNHTGPQGNGVGTVIDSLSTIEQLVFDEKRVTGKELLDVVKSNWEADEVLYTLVNSSKVHHYGNDDDYADKYASTVFDIYCQNIEGRKNPRGGTYTPGVYGVSANVPFGMITGATLDGRKAGEPISDNMGPVHNVAGSHDISGPTAIANSVTKCKHARATNGTLLNWKFNPECLSGDTGRDNFITLLDTYFEKRGMHSQFNIINSDVLRDAMKNPQNYQDMLVRVAGYSAYFVELSEPLQLDLVTRTDLSFE